MPEIRVDPAALHSGAARQQLTGADLLGAAGELSAAVSAAAEAVGDAGAGGAVGGWGASWSRSLAGLGEATTRTGGNLAAAAAAYAGTDESQMRR